MAALSERPRPLGRPGFSPEDRLKVIAAVTAVPPGADAAWSHRLLAEHLADLGISASQIGGILRDADLKPHLVRGWLTRPADPEFFNKAAALCALYRPCPDSAVVVPVDEKTGITARSRRHPDRPGGPGRRTRREFEYIRHGTASIIAALDVHTGQILTERITRNDSDTFLEEDQGLAGGAPPLPRNHTPKHASWLNQVEIFSTLTRRVLRRGQFTSRNDLAEPTAGPTTAPHSKPYEGHRRKWNDVVDSSPVRADSRATSDHFPAERPSPHRIPCRHSYV